MKSWTIRKDEKAVSPVIATILMVAITVVLAAVLYVMVTGLLAGPGATRPAVTFGAADGITNGFKFEVAAASMAKAAANYRVAFSVNGTSAGTAAALAASMTIGSYAITWNDLGSEGDLTGGDTFRVTRTGGLPGSSDFVLTVLWSDGASVGTRDYST
ncbi:MAG: archaellin/type IV pilin N-terminal domain-containing protein [Candidatus Thermoplasmatota archaeon]